LIDLCEQDKKRTTRKKAEYSRIEEYKSDLSLGNLKLIMDIDREKARRLRLSTSQIAQDMRTACLDWKCPIQRGDDDYPIQ